MAITSPQGIDLQAGEALELKTVQINNTARDAISLVTRYEGLKVYVVDTGLNWQLKNGTTNLDWVQISDELDTSLFYTKINMQTSGESQVHWDNLTNIPTTFTPSSHTHIESEISDLQAYLLTISGESIGDLSDVVITTPLEGQQLIYTGGNWLNTTPAAASIAWGSITGLISNQLDLQNELNNKRNVFSENDAFNKSFGIGNLDVARGNHIHALPYRIESTSTNSFASFEPDGTNEYLSITTNSLNTAQFGGAGHSKLTLSPDGANGINTGLWFGDGDTAIYENADDQLYWRYLGTDRRFDGASGMGSVSSNGWFLRYGNVSAINPTVIPWRQDLNTGIGSNGADQLSLIAGGVEVQRVTEGNERTATIMNGIIVEAIIDASTTIATATLTKAGENFLSTINAGDMITVYGGTTAADYGMYEVLSVDLDTQITVDRNFTVSNTDVDFDVISNGTIAENSTLDGVSTLHTPRMHFTNSYTSGSLEEGEVTWNETDNTLNLKTGFGTTLQVGQEIHIKVYNNSGGPIAEGDAVYPTGSFNDFPTIGKAITSTHESTEIDFGMATSTMADGTYGMVTWFGKVRDLDTSSYILGDVIYISASTAGELTKVKPSFPDYAIQIGIVFKVHATEGHIFVTGRNTPRETILDAWDGSIRESFDFTVSSDGITITGTLENSDNIRDLTLMFSDGFTMFDTTPAATLTLTAGTDINPQANYVYIDQATKTLQLNTGDWPTVEHTRIAYLLLRSAATTQTNDAFINQNHKDHIKTVGDNGHLLHITERLRQEAAKWHSGALGTCTVGGGGTTLDIDVASGKIFQLHRQDFPVSDTSSGEDLHIVNDSVTAFRDTTDLETQLTDSTGGSLSNSSFSFVLWGVQNETGEDSHLMINVPAGTYNRLAPDTAVSDANNYSVYDIPNAFRGVGFLIARFTFQLTAGNIWTLYDTQDLRGFQPSNAAGAASGVGGGDFTAHPDTPNSYAGEALKLIEVNAGETALEFTDSPSALILNLDPSGTFGTGTGVAFGDGDTGFYESVDDTLKLITAGVELATFTDASLTITSATATSTSLTINNDFAGGDTFLILDTMDDATVLIRKAGSNRFNFGFNDGDDVFQIYNYGTSYGDLRMHRTTGYIEIGSKITADIAQNFGTNTGYWFGDGDTGWYENSDDQLSITSGGIEGQRISEGNSRVSTVLSGIVVETIVDASTTIAVATLTKAGENFLTTVSIGDTVLVYGGTTVVDYGTYIVQTVTSDTVLTIDRNFTASNTDVDFDVVSKGIIIENSTEDGVANLHISDGDLWMGTSTAIKKLSETDWYFADAGKAVTKTDGLNLGIGRNAITNLGAGATNMLGIGDSAGKYVTAGTKAFVMGVEAARVATSLTNCTIIGSNSTYDHDGVFTGNIHIGAESAYYETGSQKLMISSLTAAEQVNEATARIKAIAYGVMSTTTVNQTLALNAQVSTPYALSVGTNTGYTSTEGLHFGDGSSKIYQHSDGNLTFETGDSISLYLTNTLLQGESTNNFLIDHTQGASSTVPIYSFRGDADTGMNRSAADTLHLITGSVSAIEIDSSQNVGIGLTSFTAKLTVKGAGTGTGINFSLEDSGGTTRFEVRDDGVIQSVKTYNSTTASAANLFVSSIGQFLRSTSSIQLKTNVVEYKDLDVFDFAPVTFNEISTGNSQIGFIAEQMGSVNDKFIQTSDDSTIVGLDTNAISAATINGLQYVKSEVDILNDKIIELENSIERIKNQLKL